MTTALNRAITAALGSMPDVQACEIARAVIADNGALIEAWTLATLTAVIERAIGRRSPDPRQAWLDLPEFQHIPAVVREETLEQYRARVAALDRKIKSYGYARRSPEKQKADKRELREMQRLDPKIAPFFAGDETMTIGRAVQMYQKQLASPTFRKGKKAIQSRWGRRTKTQ